jgi:hypothetical protein
MEMTTQTLTIAPRSALVRLLATRPTRPDIKRKLLATAPYDHEKREIPLTDAVNRIAERYDWILSLAFPLLDKATWLLVLDSQNGRSEYEAWELDRFASDLSDHLGIEPEEIPEDLDQQNVDDAPLSEAHRAIAQLAALAPVQQVFVAEIVERFWGHSGQNQSLREEIARLAKRPPGAVFRDDDEDSDTALLEH